jgi:fatty acid desaturase
MEHHLMTSVPSYKLPKMHEMLVQRSFFKDALSVQSYGEVFQSAIKKT